MDKILLMDVDWVLIKPPYYFPQKLENEWYIDSVNIMNKFFKKYNKEMTEWKISIKNIIFPYLKEIWWRKSVEEYLNEQYSFESNFLDNDLIEKIKELQKKGFKCYLATSQEKERWEYFLNKLNFKNIFDWYFISNVIWYRKDNLLFWEEVMKNLPNLEKKDILFFDDALSNINMANSFWIKSFIYTDLNKFNQDLKLI